MAREKRIYILIIRVNKSFSFFSSRCFLKEIENMYSVFLSSYRNTRENLGELEKAVETLACGSCSHSISRSPKTGPSAATTSGQYSPVQPLRSVSKQLIFLTVLIMFLALVFSYYLLECISAVSSSSLNILDRNTANLKTNLMLKSLPCISKVNSFIHL